jgi:rare lipoprotein A
MKLCKWANAPWLKHFLRIRPWGLLWVAWPIAGCSVGYVDREAALVERERAKATASRNAAIGSASWYGPGFRGKKTASGDIFDDGKFTAAHKTLPLGSRVRVTHLSNGKSVEVLINDRGPYVDGRIIDLSHAAARHLGMVESGVAEVRVEPVEYDGTSREVQVGAR